ncbi:MAG: hypothetical protein M1840_001325 [Geoglossum simile]|nr:MAG: hypothetical protein M1840_001325 [Geoglossum simile]
MSFEPGNRDWGFEPVICLLHSLSSGTTSAPGQHVAPIGLADQAVGNSKGLGNFDRLWEFLEQAKDGLPPEVHFTTSGRDPCLTDAPVLKGVRWRDETEGMELEDAVQEIAAPDLALTKAKRRRYSRVARKKTEQKALLQGSSSFATGHHSKSDSELQALRGPGSRRSLELYSAYGRSFDDSLVGPPSASAAKFPLVQTNSSCASPTQAIQALDLSPTEKKARLVLKLYQRFGADRGFLISLATPSIGVLSTGIHVFIDFSNILIGFCECVRKSHGLNVSYIRRPRFSFHSLSLILERGRPTAKKVLVGSKPLLPEAKEAEHCGYETSILDKVLKVRTPRKTRRGGSGYGTSGQSSGSETNAPLPERKVEQAVDEVLHLKIMESLLDWNEPATIVLATGDAAEAEYSGGFMKMAERALERGWRIELVSFRDCISNAYKSKAFRNKWRGRFEVIELDDFRDELLISPLLMG